MTYLDRINQDLTIAMKARDERRLSALRMIKATLKHREIEKMAPLDDDESIKALQSMVKQRRDSAKQFRDASRPELAETEEGEIAVIEEYMPRALDEATIEKIVTETLAQVGATGPKDMGKAMKAVMAAFSGKTVDGGAINQIVKAKLGNG